MNNGNLTIENRDLVKLLSTASGDAAILYLYLQSGNDPEQAMKLLNMNGTRHACAMATLRQLGLWQPEQKKLMVGERPNYTEDDVLQAKDEDRDFQSLYGELERILGRRLNTEELKIILGFIRYLGLGPEVICVLVHYCIDRARQKGSLRNPSLHTIEKEAYAWAEQGIDTLEEASAFIQAQNLRVARINRIKELLQIRGRQLTPAEEKYAGSWLQMGLAEELIREAYQRTCLNTGNMNWPYMNKILLRWHEAGLQTLEQVKTGDKKQIQPKGATGHLGSAELDAMKKFLEEGNG